MLCAALSNISGQSPALSVLHNAVHNAPYSGHFQGRKVSHFGTKREFRLSRFAPVRPIMQLSMLRPTLPCTGIGGDLTHRMCQIPHPSITIQCQIPTLYIHTRICAGTRANACAGQKPHPWGVISWRIPYQAPPLSPTGGGGA